MEILRLKITWSDMKTEMNNVNTNEKSNNVKLSNKIQRINL